MGGPCARRVVMKADGSDIVPLTKSAQDGDEGPAWAPDERKIAFASSPSRGGWRAVRRRAVGEADVLAEPVALSVRGGSAVVGRRLDVCMLTDERRSITMPSCERR